MANRSSWIYPGQQPSEKVKPGDLIEISRKNKPYKDWALCVKENEVIHIDVLSPTKAIIKQEKLENVVRSDQCHVNHRLSENYGTRDVQLILEEIQKLKDTEVPNDLLINNCEHMVTNWRHGQPEPGQVKPGDMIEIRREGKQHEDWALCVAENEVIHVVELSDTKSTYKQEKLENVVGPSDQWHVNPWLSENCGASDVQLIVEEVQKLKDTEVPYEPGQAQMAVPCLVGVLSLVVLLFVVRRTVRRWKEPEGRQRRSTGPREEGGETVSEVEARPPHADTTALVASMLFLMMLPTRLQIMRWEVGRQRRSIGPREEGGETVSEEEAKPPHAETPAEREPVQRQLRH